MIAARCKKRYRSQKMGSRSMPNRPSLPQASPRLLFPRRTATRVGQAPLSAWFRVLEHATEQLDLEVERALVLLGPGRAAPLPERL